MAESLRVDTIQGMGWSAVERFSVQLIQFIIGIVLARLLTPDDFGTIGVLNIFLAVSQTFIDSGFSNALIRKSDRTEVDFSTAFFFNIVVGVFFYLILFICAPVISIFFNIPILTPVVRVIAVNLFLNSLAIVQRAKLSIDVNFKTQAISSFVAVVISGIVGMYMAYSGCGVWSLVYQSVLNTFVNVLLLWLLARWHPYLLFSWKSFKNLFAFGSKLLTASLLNVIYVNLNSIMIGKFYKPSDLGYYSRGDMVAALPSNNFTGIVQRVTFPILARIQDDDNRLLDIYRQYICWSSFIIFPLMVMLVSVAKPLVLLLLTDKWSECIVLLQILCFGYMFDHISQINLNLLQVKGRSDLILKLEVIKKTISIALLFLALPFGVVILCLSRVFYTQIAILLNTYYTGKLIGFGYFAQWKDIIKYLIVSLICNVPAFLLSISGLNNMLVVCISLIISLLLYCLLLRKDQCMIDLLLMVKNKINGSKRFV